jgi:hypothetical protein
MKKFLTAPRTITTFVFVAVAMAANVAAAQTTGSSPIMDVNPLLNLVTIALVIERLMEIGMVLYPGLEEKKLELQDNPTELAKFQILLQRITLVVGMVLGLAFCLLFQFGILHLVFPGQMSSQNAINHIITGLIAGSGSEPVHQLVLIIIGLRERLRTGIR